MESDRRFNLIAVTDMGFKGRAQDGNLQPQQIAKAIYKNPNDSVPKLIASLTDSRETKEPVICPAASNTTVGDITLMILADMFLDSSWKKSTVPGASLDELIGPNPKNQDFMSHLHDYVHKHGRLSLQRKWKQIWSANKDRITWDEEQRCFVLTSHLKKVS